MRRRVLVIRHAHSTANDEGQAPGMTAADLAFANQNAGLSKRGEEQCAALAPQLAFALSIAKTPVAHSHLARTRLTAELVGFRKLRADHALDEVDYTSDMDLATLRARLRRNDIPQVALRAADWTLRNAPRENVWITHGLLIAGLSIVLGVANQYKRPVPSQCEARYLTL